MGYPLNHLIDDLVARLITNNPTYAPAGPPDFNDAQLSAMNSTCVDIATAVHNHILSWYVEDGSPFPDELVKANPLDPTAGYLVDKIDNFTIALNPSNFRLYVANIPLASSSVIGGIKLTDDPNTCLYISNSSLYVKTQQNLFNSNVHTEVPTVRAVKDYVTAMVANITGGTGLGDMLKITYDQDDNGIIDNSERLGGQLPSYYLDYNNFTNTPVIDKYNFYQNLEINKHELRNAVIHNALASIESPVGGMVYFNTTDKNLYFYNGTVWKPWVSLVDEFNSLTEETLIASNDFVVIYDSSVSTYRKITRANFIAGLGAGIANAYDKISDGTTIATASSNDTIRFRANTGLTLIVGSNDATYGDNILYGLDLNALTAVTSLVDADKLPIYISDTGNRNITYANFKTRLNTDKFIKGPSYSTTGNIPTYANTTANLLTDGYSVESILVGSTSAIPRADAVKAYIDSAIGGNFWSLNGTYLSPGNSSYLVNIPTTSGIYFGDNDTHIRQTIDDTLTFSNAGVTTLTLNLASTLISNYLEIFRNTLPLVSFGLYVHGNYNKGIVVTVGDTCGYYYEGSKTAYSSLNLVNTIGLEIKRESLVSTNDYSNLIHLETTYTSNPANNVLSGNFIGIIDHEPTGTTNINKTLSVLCGTGSGSNVERLRLWPRVPNGSTAVAYVLDTVSSLTFSGALLLSLRNTGVQKFWVDKDGNVNIPSGTNYYIGGVAVGGLSVNNFVNNNLITCGASSNTLEGESTLNYDASTHTLQHTYGTGTLARYYIIGSNTVTAGKALVELSTGDSLFINKYGDSNTTTLFTHSMAGNSSIYTNDGSLYIGTYANDSLYLGTNNVPWISIDNTGKATFSSYVDISAKTTIGGTYAPLPGTLHINQFSHSSTSVYINSFRADSTVGSKITFFKSHSNTIGTVATTPEGSRLGQLAFYGAWGTSQQPAGWLDFIQVGTSGYIGMNMSFYGINLSTGIEVERFRLSNDGNFYCTGTVYANQAIPSDMRLKYGFEEIENPLEKIKNLMGKKFRYTSAYKPDDDGKLHIGFIAQDVEKILPEVIVESEILGLGNTKYKMIAYDEIIPVLVEAIKELSQQVQYLSKGTIKNKRP